MAKVVVRRLLVMPLLLLGIITATFILAQFTKGNPLVSIIGARALSNPEVVAAAKARWGLDRSVPERYAIYVWNLAHGDLGTSFRTKQPVLTDLSQRLPATLELVIFAMIVAGIGGVVLAVVSAEFNNTVADHAARFIALVGSCMPVFWLGLIVLFLFSVQFKILPGPGRSTCVPSRRQRSQDSSSWIRSRQETGVASSTCCAISSCRASCLPGR